MIKFTVPLIPYSQNKWDRMHWRKRHRIMGNWILITKSICQKFADKFDSEGKVRVNVYIYFKTKHLRDTQNYIAGLKGLYDGIEKAGIVNNDSQIIPEIPIFKYDKDNPRTEIELGEIK